MQGELLLNGFYFWAFPWIGAHRRFAPTHGPGFAWVPCFVWAR